METITNDPDSKNKTLRFRTFQIPILTLFRISIFVLRAFHHQRASIIRVCFDIPKWLEWPFVAIVLLYRRIRYGYAFRRIPLTRGKYAIVDPDDFERLSRHKWQARQSRRTFYAGRAVRTKKGGPQTCLWMHREILNVPDGIFVDHINRNSLDNRKANLRPATHTQNAWNTSIPNKNKTSKYKGVHFYKRHKVWQAAIRVNGVIKHLGRFKDEVEAAKAYDRAAKKLRGEFAVLNFEDEKRSNANPG